MIQQKARVRVSVDVRLALLIVMATLTSGLAHARETMFAFCEISSYGPEVHQLTPVFPFQVDALGGLSGSSKVLNERFFTFATVSGLLTDDSYADCYPSHSLESAEEDRANWSAKLEVEGARIVDLPATAEQILGVRDNLNELTCSITAVSTEKFGGGVERLPPRDWHVKFDEAAGYLSINNAHIWRSGDFEIDFDRVRDADFSQDFITFCPTFAGDCGVQYKSFLGMATVYKAQINRRNGAFEWTTWDLFSGGGPNGGAESVTAVYTGSCAPAAPPRF